MEHTTVEQTTVLPNSISFRYGKTGYEVKIHWYTKATLERDYNIAKEYIAKIEEDFLGD